MAIAKYEVLIPQTGRDVAGHALNYLVQHHRPKGNAESLSHIDRGREFLANGQPILHDVLVHQGDDSPYTDSFIKQLAAYVGQVVGHPTITVSKSGKNGINVWPIRS